MENDSELLKGPSAYLQAQIFVLDVVLTSVVSTHPAPKVLLAQLTAQIDHRMRFVRAIREQHDFDPAMERAMLELLENWVQLAQRLASEHG